MLRITRKTNERVSNRLAVLAAMLLIGSAVAGMSGQQLNQQDEALVADSNTMSSLTATTQPAARKEKRFKVSLFLFR